MPASRPLRSVVALVGESAAAFQLGIVCQVFGLDRSDDGLPVYDFAVCGPRPGPVPTTSGFDLTVSHGLDRLATAELITVPAWPALDAPLPGGVAQALRAAQARGTILMSICSGAFALAGAGVLDGRRATTHWQFAQRLAIRYPRVQVDPDVLYVDGGQILTSAGASAGLDACLHLVGRELGTATANALARRMVLPVHRTGGQAQYIEMPLTAHKIQDDVSELIDWLPAHLHELLTVQSLAARAHMSPRTFARRFRAATGTTPHRWVLDQRLNLAESLLESSDLTVDAVAARAGFGSPDTLRHHFGQRRGISPAGHRRAFGHTLV